MHKTEDTIRIATLLGERFSIYTTNPVRLGKFARDLLETGERFSLTIRESLERVARW